MKRKFLTLSVTNVLPFAITVRPNDQQLGLSTFLPQRPIDALLALAHAFSDFTGEQLRRTASMPFAILQVREELAKISYARFAEN